MKQLLAAFGVLGVVLALGCGNQGTSGGPGATGTTSKATTATTNKSGTSSTTSSTGTTTPGTGTTGTTTGTGTSGTTTSGSTTTDKTGDKTGLGGLTQADRTFSLDMPNLSTSLKQGEAKNISIGINRGKNFDQDVTLKFGDLPKGVSIDPASPAIKAGDKEAKITVKAADDAALGDFNIPVHGHPASGPDATNTFKITVNKK